MKAGSIVVCLPTKVHEHWDGRIKWLPVMDKNTPYMIREIYPTSNGGPGILFEEGIIGYNFEGQELSFPADNVRELLPPADVFKLIEEINFEVV